MSDVQRRLSVEGDAARILLANIRDVVADDEELAITAIEGETGLVEAISDAVNRLAALEAHQEALAAQIKALGERKERFSAQHGRIKAAVLVAMHMAHLRKLELAQATLSVRPVAPKVEVTDEAAIPPSFWKPSDPKLDKRALLEALKNKQAVPGASLSNGGETLSIGVK